MLATLRAIAPGHGELRLTPAELLRLDHLEADAPGAFAAALSGLRTRFGLQVLGGCCDTDDRHIGALGAGSQASGRDGRRANSLVGP